MTIIDLHANAYVNDILAQPQALRDTLAGLATDQLDAIAERWASGRYRQIVLTGMGSSFHALHPIHLELLAHGLWAQRLETSELIHFAPEILTDDTLVVVVSQSGRSAEILRLLERNQGKSAIIAITNSADNPLADQADVALVTRAGVESAVSCKTYVTGLVALSLLSAALTGQDVGARAKLWSAVPDLVAQYLSHWQDHVGAARSALSGIRALYYTGRGPSQATAGTGGLTTKESTHFPAEGMGGAAFRHGPFELIDSDVAVFVFEGDGPTAALNTALAADVAAAGGRALLVRRGGEGWLSLPDAPALALPVLEILPVQMSTLALATARGHAPGVFRLGTKVTEVE